MPCFVACLSRVPRPGVWSTTLVASRSQNALSSLLTSPASPSRKVRVTHCQHSLWWGTGGALTRKIQGQAVGYLAMWSVNTSLLYASPIVQKLADCPLKFNILSFIWRCWTLSIQHSLVLYSVGYKTTVEVVPWSACLLYFVEHWLCYNSNECDWRWKDMIDRVVWTLLWILPTPVSVPLAY